MHIFSLLLFVLISYTQNKETEVYKRILLDNPNVFQNQGKIVDEVQRQKIAALDSEVKSLLGIITRHQGTSGSTYVRWGRTRCDGNGTHTVYKGYTAGTLYTAIGASNVLCLPDNPEFGKLTGAGNDVHGAEYDTNIFGKNTNGEDIPCTRCDTPRKTSVMIPGRTGCYPGWNLEYTGYLALGHSASTSQFICIDKNSEGIAGGEGKTYDGRRFFPVVSRCGTLNCPPYHDRYNLACVVCSK